MRKLSTEEQTEHASMRIKKSVLMKFRRVCDEEGRSSAKQFEKIFEEWLSLTGRASSSTVKTLEYAGDDLPIAHAQTAEEYKRQTLEALARKRGTAK